MLIGTNIIDEEEKRQKPSLPFTKKPPLTQYQMKIDNLIEGFKTLQDQVKENNENLLNLCLQSRAFNKVVDTIKTKGDMFVDEIEDVSKHYQEKENQLKKKKDLRKEKECLWRNLTFLCNIGRVLVLQLKLLVKEAEKLIRDNKWYPYEIFHQVCHTQFQYYNEAFSIPE